MVIGVLLCNMYRPEVSVTGFGDSVIVLTEDGFAFGRYTGNSREHSESYEVRVEDMMTGEKHDEWFHKEDIYQNTEENLERVRQMV